MLKPTKLKTSVWDLSSVKRKYQIRKFDFLPRSSSNEDADVIVEPEGIPSKGVVPKKDFKPYIEKPDIDPGVEAIVKVLPSYKLPEGETWPSNEESRDIEVKRGRANTINKFIWNYARDNASSVIKPFNSKVNDLIFDINSYSDAKGFEKKFPYLTADPALRRNCARLRQYKHYIDACRFRINEVRQEAQFQALAWITPEEWNHCRGNYEFIKAGIAESARVTQTSEYKRNVTLAQKEIDRKWFEYWLLVHEISWTVILRLNTSDIPLVFDQGYPKKFEDNPTIEGKEVMKTLLKVFKDEAFGVLRALPDQDARDNYDIRDWVDNYTDGSPKEEDDEKFISAVNKPIDISKSSSPVSTAAETTTTISSDSVRSAVSESIVQRPTRGKGKGK